MLLKAASRVSAIAALVTVCAPQNSAGEPAAGSSSLCRLTVEATTGGNPHKEIFALRVPHSGCASDGEFTLIVEAPAGKGCETPVERLTIVRAEVIDVAEAQQLLGACLPHERPTEPASPSSVSYLWTFEATLNNGLMDDIDFELQNVISTSAAPFQNYVRSSNVVCIESLVVEPRAYFNSIDALPVRAFSQSRHEADCYTTMTSMGMVGVTRHERTTPDTE